jgi:hypothetical protein
MVHQLPETNVRTYVVGPDGREGLWFFSLDAARLEPVLVARSTYALPYMWSQMTVERDGSTIRYRSRRRWPGPTPATSAITLEIGGPLAPEQLGPFDHYLTARWQLYTTLGPLLARSTVEHEPWPLHRAAVRPAGREPGCGRRATAPRRGAGGALVARGADQDQRAAPARTSLTSRVGQGRRNQPRPGLGRLIYHECSSKEPDASESTTESPTPRHTEDPS